MILSREISYNETLKNVYLNTVNYYNLRLFFGIIFCEENTFFLLFDQLLDAFNLEV